MKAKKEKLAQTKLQLHKHVHKVRLLYSKMVDLRSQKYKKIRQ